MYRENPPYGYGFLICSQQNNNNRIEQTKTTQDLCFGGESHLEFEVFLSKVSYFPTSISSSIVVIEYARLQSNHFFPNYDSFIS